MGHEDPVCHPRHRPGACLPGPGRWRARPDPYPFRQGPARQFRPIFGGCPQGGPGWRRSGRCGRSGQGPGGPGDAHGEPAGRVVLPCDQGGRHPAADRLSAVQMQLERRRVGWFLEKTSGSQRTQGHFYDDGPTRLTYVGAGHVAGEAPRRYGQDAKENQVAFAERRDPNRIVLMFPEPQYESKLDILVLER
ncbi:MAG: DUF4893 domain-containing protein [Hyphomicrobiales bacterium]|nr:MAG: DUF4893 domain-containing protein [Hyphomicrobiales bacterium]